jgi:hypothetical protein
MKDEKLTKREAEMYEQGYVDAIWWVLKIMLVSTLCAIIFYHLIFKGFLGY